MCKCGVNRQVKPFLVLITNLSLNLNQRWTHYSFGFLKIHIPVHHPFELHLGSSWSWVRSSSCIFCYQATPWFLSLPIRIYNRRRSFSYRNHHFTKSGHWLLISPTANLPCVNVNLTFRTIWSKGLWYINWTWLNWYELKKIVYTSGTCEFIYYCRKFKFEVWKKKISIHRNFTVCSVLVVK